MHEDFATIASELRIWTFYETIDSQLSGSGSKNHGTAKEVRFGAPIVSIKSSLVGVRQERVFALDSEHANCASFGQGNTEIMGSYLTELAAAVKKATDLSSEYIHTPLSLKKHVKVEIIGFYDDPDAQVESDIRLYFTKLHLEEFLEKGPERCLEERLRRTTLRPRSDPVPDSQSQEDSQQSSSGLAPSPHPSPNLSGRVSPAAGPSSSYLYLYMPYLHFDTYIDVLQRRKFILRRMQHGRARPVPREIAGLESPELRMIWEYIGYDPPLNYRRTLDQFAYPSLRDTWARDDDQMLYKLTKDRDSGGANRELMTLTRRQTLGSTGSPFDRLSPSSTGLLEEESDSDDETEDLEEVIKDGKVLMVDQLWLWAIDKKTLTTFFSKRESKAKEGPLFGQADLRNSVYNELNGDLTGRCENALDLAAFVVLHAVTVLLDRASHPDLEIFRIFEEAISMLTERMTSSLKRFRMQTFKDVGVDSDSESNRPESIKKRHKRELQEAERENRENTSALMELRDLEDELKSLERLFEAQDAAVKNMKSIFESEELKMQTRNGRMYLEEALGKLDEYRSQTGEMLKRVDTTRNDYEKLLEMVQRQAQVDEVRWSRLQTELASSQNLSVMIFTTFTVIFLPLSFFTGLFGMNTTDWDSDKGTLPSLRDIGSISLPVSIFLIVAALVGAFSSRVQEVVRGGYKGGKKVIVFAWSGVKKVVPEKRRERRRQRIDNREREERKTRMRDRGYDFWASVRRERGSEYRIPEVNRNKTSTHPT
ncbi:Protein SERAC1 [Colletotrichum sp. SAR11_239]|nr:Protein SERAC1 [Colletotrichum sp. SAR11_239]